LHKKEKGEMKRRKLLSAYLATLIVASFLVFIPKTNAITGTGMYIEPPTKYYPATPNPIGLSFTVEIRAANFTELFTIGGSLKWNATILNMTSYAWGDMGWGAGIQMDPVIDYALGKAEGFGWTSKGPTSTVSGSAYKVFFTATFKIKSFGISKIDLYDCDMIDTYGTHLVTPYPFNPSYDCTVTVEKPAPSPPTAAFIWSPPLPSAGQTVTFDARGSLGGFDGTNPTDIEWYYFDWTNNGTSPDDYNGTSAYPVTHVFDAAGIYTVNLTVYAPPGPGADPGYVPKASVTHDITVIPPAVGRHIDVYTQSYRHPGYYTIYIGEGPNQPADSFAPQDNVTLYANVSYNNWPVQNKPVAFAVYGPYNIYQNITVERTVFTNEDGVAEINFRIPWPCEHAEDIVFGTWNVLAKVDIADQSVNDTLTFYVNWIIHLKPGSITFEDVMGTPRTTFAHGEHVRFDFEVNNNAMMDRLVYFTIVVYDELGVPFAEITFFKTIHPGHGYVYVIDCQIPKWAYAGIATAYINAYSNDPWACGVAYCPEISGSFLIEAA
jgi:hypothetical protein